MCSFVLFAGIDVTVHWSSFAPVGYYNTIATKHRLNSFLIFISASPFSFLHQQIKTSPDSSSLLSLLTIYLSISSFKSFEEIHILVSPVGTTIGYRRKLRWAFSRAPTRPPRPKRSGPLSSPPTSPSIGKSSSQRSDTSVCHSFNLYLFLQLYSRDQSP